MKSSKVIITIGTEKGFAIPIGFWDNPDYEGDSRLDKLVDGISQIVEQELHLPEDMFCIVSRVEEEEA